MQQCTLFGEESNGCSRRVRIANYEGMGALRRNNNAPRRLLPAQIEGAAMRLRRFAYSKAARGISRTAAITLLAGEAVAVEVGFANSGWAQTFVPQESRGAGADGARQLSGPYLKWVDEDVRWIITPEERAAYIQLPDNSERLHFIQQFWDRHNPTPGSAQNTFKEEHYRRIAYANVHFAAGKAGWISDRGRAYILKGPPDSIDSHPSGSSGEAMPYEVWQYGQSQVKFVDRCRCGNYELQPTLRF